MAANDDMAAFTIALPSLDDDDDTEELFSVPQPRFGHPTGNYSSSTASSFDAPTPPCGSSHLRGHSGASSSDVHNPYARKDSSATSSGDVPSSFGFPPSARAPSSSAHQLGSVPRSVSASTGGLRSGQVVKKSSFVSLKSAFTNSKHAPAFYRSVSLNATGSAPLPEGPAGNTYPVLRNPFSRSASSNAALGAPPSSFSSSANPANARRKGAGGRSSAGQSQSSTAQGSTFWADGPSHQSRPSQYSTTS